MADTINVEILEDGTLKIITDQISAPNHAGVEALIRQMVSDAGGESQRIRKGTTTAHTHGEHVHEH